MKRNERVLAYIQSPEYVPMKLRELMLVLGVPDEDRDEFSEILEDWIRKGKIFRNKRKKYESAQNGQFLSGTLQCSARGFFGFLIPEDETESDVYISGEHMQNALDGDRILVQLTPGTEERREGRVLRILEQKDRVLSGVVKRKKEEYFEIRSDSSKIFAHFRLRPEHAAGAAVGDRILFRILGLVNEHYEICTVRVLGSAHTLRSHTDAILFSHDIKTEFEAETLTSVNAFSGTLSPAELANRHDFREELVITIDGEDARDYDDAVSVSRSAGGGFRLAVHIADVSHYVVQSSPQDLEAYERGTSVYLPDRVVPMLPPRLSDDLCSLRPHCDRLTLSLVMEIGSRGKIHSYRLTEGVIRSAERMTYTDVTKLLEKSDPELSKHYAHLLPMLSDMQTLANRLHSRRKARGSLDFEFPEPKFILNEENEPIEIIPQERTEAHKIIEEFMLAANETVAEFACKKKIPCLYRIHRAPDAEKLSALRKFLSGFGIVLPEEITPKDLQKVLIDTADYEEADMIAVFLLRSLMKAEYFPENLGHFGLAAKYYCHFTSPIRRYPDLMVHRILKAYLKHQSTAEYLPLLRDAAAHSSQKEQSAELCERDTDDLFKTHYLSQYIACIFPAKISGVTSFGIFAELENSIEGFIPLEHLKDDYYRFDETHRILIGEHTGRIRKIGNTLEVAVVRCDLLNRRIDLLPAEHATREEIEKLRQKKFRSERQLEQKKAKNSKKRKQPYRRKRRKRGKKHGSI